MIFFPIVYCYIVYFLLVLAREEPIHDFLHLLRMRYLMYFSVIDKFQVDFLKAHTKHYFTITNKINIDYNVIMNESNIVTCYICVHMYLISHLCIYKSHSSNRKISVVLKYIYIYITKQGGYMR